MSEKYLIKQDKQRLVYCSSMSWIQSVCREEVELEEMQVVLVIECSTSSLPKWMVQVQRRTYSLLELQIDLKFLMKPSSDLVVSIN